VHQLVGAKRRPRLCGADAILTFGFKKTKKTTKASFCTPKIGKTSMKEDYLKRYRHAPAHLFLTDYHYFITAGTYEKKPCFDSDVKKKLLFNTICKILKENYGKLQGWVILANHYHILTKLKDAFFLPQITRKIHSISAVLVNKVSKQPGRKIWYQYWDECIRDERDYYAKLNYIQFNPVKHGYVWGPEEYKFSSYNHYLKIEGVNWLEGIFKHFPPKEVEKDDF
jgi:putative transposase